MLRPKLFIEGVEVDLFDDERLQFDLNLKDFRQFDKTISSYTQPFTIPASKVNNRIFEHYYDATVDTSYNPNTSLNATLEINNIPYRTGVVKLERAEVRNGMPFSYQIVFYDSIANLKDQLGDKRLYEIGWTHSFNTLQRENSFDTLLQFSGSQRNALFTPLIGTWKFFTYTKDSNDAADRSDSPLYIFETRPAVAVKYILDQIQTNTGLSIEYPIDKIGNPDGSAATDAQGCMYMWANRTQGQLVDFEAPWTLMETEAVVEDASGFWSDTTHTLTIPNNLASTIDIPIGIATIVAEPQEWEAEICAYNTGTNTIVSRLKCNKSGPGGTLTLPFPNTGGSSSFQFYVRTAYPIVLGTDALGRRSSFTFTYLLGGGILGATSVRLNNFISSINDTGGKMYLCDTNYTTLGETYTARGQLPNMRVFDFLVGLAKMFNWVLFFEGGKYSFKSLDQYYSEGEKRNWTAYVDRLNYQASKVDFYGELKFLYEPNDAVLSKQFFNTVGGGRYGYGDLVTRVEDTNGNLINSEVYEVKLPFSNIIWERPTTVENTTKNFYIANAVDIDGNPVELSGLLMYYNSLNSINNGDELKINRKFDNATIIDLTQVHVASERSSAGTSFDQSLNWGTEINIASNVTDPVNAPTLYNEFYKDFITDLYDLNARYYEFDAVLPLGEILEVELNDEIQIGNMSYFINSMSVDLTTGKAKLRLRNAIE